MKLILITFLFFFFIVFSSEREILELIDKIKSVPPHERYIYMNRLKLKLRELNEEQREKVIRELYREFKGRYHERDEREYEKEEIHKGGEEPPLHIEEREHEGIDFESEHEERFTEEREVQEERGRESIREEPEFEEIPEKEIYPPSGEERHEERYEERYEGKHEDKEVSFEKDYEKEEEKEERDTRGW